VDVGRKKKKGYKTFTFKINPDKKATSEAFVCVCVPERSG
jgi:hypothetical protein